MNPGDESFPQQGVGARLRAAREAEGLSTSEVGQRLKMPARVVESLEAEDWKRLGAPVFVRGQLRSYARLLGLPIDQVVAMPELAPVTATELHPRTFTPPMQRFAEQAARRSVYIVLTLAILVPVWVATRPQTDSLVQQTTPLEQPVSTNPGSEVRNAPPARTPMRAALTPLPPRAEVAPAPALALQFDGDSWIEIRGADGQVLESGLLKAGDTRSYTAGQVSRLKLGNAGSVRVLNAGQAQDLTPYIRANVARVAVSSDGSLEPPAE